MRINRIEYSVVVEMGLLRLSPSAKIRDGQKSDLWKSGVVLTRDFRIAWPIEILGADFLAFVGIDEFEE